MIVMKKILIHNCNECPNKKEVGYLPEKEVQCSETGATIAGYWEWEKDFDDKLNSISVWCSLLDN
jgi:hypothetical protein